MSNLTVRFPVVFGPQRDRPRANVTIVALANAPAANAATPRTPKRRTAAATVGDTPPDPSLTAPTDAPTSRTARSLALATLIRRKIDAGEIRDHAHAAALLGLTPPNLNYIMNLLHLAADIQERLLVSDLVVSERSLRPVARLLLWEEQRRAITP
jgi:hypothetical protein